MRTILSFILLNFLVSTISAQSGHQILDHNNASAYISNEGSFLTDFGIQNRGYLIPKQTEINGLEYMQFWYAGITATGDTNFLLGGDPSIGSPLTNGPFSTNNSYTDSTYQSDWNSSVIMLSQEEIDNFKLWWMCLNGQITIGCDNVEEPSAETLSSIYSWPGNGNVTNGEAPYLAPYFDINMDGQYNPDDGDYPIIKGCKAVYLIQNDVGYSMGLYDVGLEVHYMFYQYLGWNSYLNNTTFVDVMAINKGNNDYTDFSNGLFVSGYLGYTMDNYFGSDSSKNLMYFYNADNFDEDNGSTLGYGSNPASIGIVALEENVTSVVPSNYTGSLWANLHGKKANGQDWIDLSGNTTKYAYSGNPNNSAEWSELSSLNPPGSRSGVMSTTRGVFNSGDTIRQTYAILFSNDGSNVENAQDVINLATEAKYFHENGSMLPCQDGVWGIDEIERPDEISIYPNPSMGIVQFQNKTNEKIIVQISDLIGNAVSDFSVRPNDIFESDLSHLSAGTYVVNIIGQTVKKVERIVIQ